MVKIPVIALRTARVITHRDAPPFYIEPGNTYHIGYLLVPLNRPLPTPDVAGVRIIQISRPPVKATCRITRGGAQNPLCFISIVQERGVVIYEWPAPDGTSRHLIAFGDNEDDTAEARRVTKAALTRNMQVWRLMMSTGESEDAVRRVLTAVNKVSLVAPAFVVAGDFRKRYKGKKTTLIHRALRQLREPENAAARKALFARLRLRLTTPQGIAVLRGAGHAIGRG